MLVAADRGVDPGWPPVLIVFVVLAISAAVASCVVVYRALRSERGATRRGRRGGVDRRRKGKGKS